MPIQKALVTGGAGFIGQHLVKALLARSIAVVVLDNLSVGSRANVPGEVEFIEGDLRDPAACARALAKVDAVFHLAAVVSVRASIDNFVTDAEVNVLGTLRLLEAMQQHSGQIRKAVLASSMAVYADSAAAAPLPESWSTHPVSPYGAGKLAAEHYWHLLCAQAGIESTALRLFNTWGPGQTPSPYVGVLTHFARRLLEGEPLQIFGDGEQRRDFVHVEDVAQAFVRVLDSSASGKTLNVGTGLATSVNEVAAGLVSAFKSWHRREFGGHKEHQSSPSPSAERNESRPPPASPPQPEFAPALPPLRIQHLPPRPGELRNAIADISAAQRVLGFSPQHRLFEEEMDWLFKPQPEG